MGYHGVPSKGCEQCRKRKVKCDQRRPTCRKCERVNTPCPGYRNLADVLFRDESARVAQKARAEQDEDLSQCQPSSSASTTYPIPPFHLTSTNIPQPLHQPLSEHAAAFFFTKYYSCDGDDSWSHRWLAQCYPILSQDHALRAVIQAAGMAGLSNVHHSRSLAARSKKQYGLALEALKKSLGDPVESVKDETLMTVGLFGFFEFITFDAWTQSRAWAAHIAGAIALLQLRGREQFGTERGGWLFLQVRSQMLYACVQHDVPLPAEFTRLSRMFDDSDMGRRRQESRPGPLGSIVFRLLHLRDVVRGGEMGDRRTVWETAVGIDRDLVEWSASLPGYQTVDVDASRGGLGRTYFQGKRHVYRNLLIAQAWNNWRTLRVVLNRMILDCDRDDNNDTPGASSAVSTVRELSTDICTSASSFRGSPREYSPNLVTAAKLLGVDLTLADILGIIWPLSVVAKEPSNPLATRRWAVDELRDINTSMGFRQAGLLADTISRELGMPG